MPELEYPSNLRKHGMHTKEPSIASVCDTPGRRLSTISVNTGMTCSFEGLDNMRLFAVLGKVLKQQIHLSWNRTAAAGNSIFI